MHIKEKEKEKKKTVSSNLETIKSPSDKNAKLNRVLKNISAGKQKRPANRKRVGPVRKNMQLRKKKPEKKS